MRAGEPSRGVSSGTASTISFGAAMLWLVPVLMAVAATALVSCWKVVSLARAANRVASIHLTLDHLENLRSLLEEAERSERDYVITGAQNNWQTFQDAADRTGQELSTLEAMSRNQPLRYQRITALANLIRARLSVLNDSIQVRTQMGPDAALQMSRSNSGHSVSSDIPRRVDDMIDEQRELLADSSADKKFNLRPAVRFIAGTSAACLVLMLLAAVFIARKFRLMRNRIGDLSKSYGAVPDQSKFMDAVLGVLDAGVVLLDRDLKVVRSNPLAQQLLDTGEARPLDNLKAELESATSGDSLTFAFESFQTGLSRARNSATTDLSIGGIDKNSVASIAATARAIRDDSGALEGGVLLFRDTTAAKSIEHALQAREETLIGIFHYGLEAALIATLDDSLCVGVNEGFVRLSGYPRDEVVGRGLEELRVFSNPADLRYAMERVRTGQFVRERASCVAAKGGRAFEATLSIVPIEFSGLACALISLSGIEWRSRYFSSIRGLMPSPPHPRRTDLALPPRSIPPVS
jgi:PAS domain S-box-containing protein